VGAYGTCRCSSRYVGSELGFRAIAGDAFDERRSASTGIGKSFAGSYDTNRRSTTTSGNVLGAGILRDASKDPERPDDAFVEYGRSDKEDV
jgi:hypothetical protein